MANFSTQLVGGPADGTPLNFPRAPQGGEIWVWTSHQKIQHRYEFKCIAFQPPAFHHVGIVDSWSEEAHS